MYHNRKIDRREEEHVYAHIRRAGVRFRNFGRNFCRRMAQVVFRVDVALVLLSAVCVRLEEVCPCLCASSVSLDY